MGTGLEDGVAVVTGGAGTRAGLGRGLVRGFADVGMRVAILDVDLPAASQFAGVLRAEGVDALACEVDVSDHASLDAAADVVRDTFGACHVLCAHVGSGVQGPFDRVTIDDWRRVLEVSVVGTVATIHAFLPLMRASEGLRRIVLTASAAALAPGRYQAPYRAAKVALTSIGETLDLELADEGIGATIAFPSGMVPADLVEVAREARDTVDASHDPVLRVISEEMVRDATDVAAGEDAARAVVDAVVQGRRYVVTHGVTVVQSARERQRRLDEAFAEVELRHGKA